jgi:hypothetical protein
VLRDDYLSWSGNIICSYLANGPSIFLEDGHFLPPFGSRSEILLLHGL